MGLQRGMCHHLAMHLPNRHLVFFVALILIGVEGCATAPPAEAPRTTGEAAKRDEIASVAAAPTVEAVDIPIPPESVLPLLEAEFALRAGQFGHALTLLSQQMALLPDPNLARRALRLAEFLQNEDRALEAAIRLTTLDPSDGAAASTVMARLARDGQTNEALRYAKLAKSRGSRINAPLLVANYEALTDEHKQSVKAGLEALASAWPDDNDIAIAQALLYRERGQSDEALGKLEKILKRVADEDRALVLWTQLQIDVGSPEPFSRIAAAVEQAPTDERLRLQYARLLASNKSYQLAREQFSALIDQSPRNDEYLMATALIDLELGALTDAESALQALLDLGQRPAEANYYLGRVREKAGRVAAAVAAYGEVEPSKEFMDAKRRAANMLRKQGDNSDYVAFFNEQRWRFPQQSQQLYLLEAELQRRSNPLQARAVYDVALNDFPDSVSLRYARAMLFEAAGDIESMETDLRHILSNDPNNAATLNALGYSLTNHTHRYAEAAELIERALRLSPQDPAMLDSLGWVYFKLGRYTEAESLLKDAYRLLPDPEVAAHLGETLWAQGKQREAEEVWRAGLARDPQSRHIREALDRLGVLLRQ